MLRISQLPSLTEADNSDEIAIVDVSASTTKKITRGDLLKAPLPANSVTTAAIANNAVTAQKMDSASFPTIKTQQAASTSSQNMEITSPGVVIISGVARKISAGASTGKINVSGGSNDGSHLPCYSFRRKERGTAVLQYTDAVSSDICFGQDGQIHGFSGTGRRSAGKAAVLSAE